MSTKHIYTPRPNYRSTHCLSDALPFVTRIGRNPNRWDVPPTNGYTDACFVGREYAAHLVEYLAQNPDSGPILRLIAADMDFAEHADSKGYQIGFFEFLEECLLLTTQYRDIWEQGQQYNRQYRERLAGLEESEALGDAASDAFTVEVVDHDRSR